MYPSLHRCTTPQGTVILHKQLLPGRTPHLLPRHLRRAIERDPQRGQPRPMRSKS